MWMEVNGGKVFDGSSWREGVGWKWLEGRCWMEVVGRKVLDGSAVGGKVLEGREQH